mmetsp:Transcript_46805/g.110132  ORF Transcript_46805/g.110132 Transcript_46805/m.110132 type:complete len:438 (-) Transcript_46805:248-1561(-)
MPSHCAALLWLPPASRMTISNSGRSTSLISISCIECGSWPSRSRKKASRLSRTQASMGLGGVFFWALMAVRSSCSASFVGLGLVVVGGRCGRRQPFKGLAEVVEPVAQRLHLLVAALQGVHLLAEGLAARQAAHGPADVLAGAAHAAEFAVQAVVVVQMLGEHVARFGHRGGRQAFARRQEVGHLAEDPRPALGRPADHQRVGAGVGQHLARLLGRIDVAVGDDRDGQRCLHRRNRVVFGQALVALLAGAPMHRQHRNAGGLEQARQPQRIALLGAPAGAHLQRDRHAAGHATSGAHGHDGLDDLQRQRLVAHQRRAGPLVAHLLGRAAHVDVDDLGAAVDVVGGGLGHHGRIGAGDLHRDRAGLAGMVGAARGLQAAPQLLARRDHFADRIARAQPPAQLAEGPVRDPRHRRHEEPVGEGMGADAHGGLLKNEARL